MTENTETTETIAAEKIPLSEAMEMLTQGEIGLIERRYTKLYGEPQHFGGEGDRELSPMATMTGVIWANEKRRLGKAYDWEQADALTLKECNSYFAPEPIDIDPEEPTSESGKDSAPDASPRESEPSSAPY